MGGKEVGKKKVKQSAHWKTVWDIEHCEYLRGVEGGGAWWMACRIMSGTIMQCL